MICFTPEELEKHDAQVVETERADVLRLRGELAAQSEKLAAVTRDLEIAHRVVENHKAEAANAVRIGCENITAREKAEARIKELEAVNLSVADSWEKENLRSIRLGASLAEVTRELAAEAAKVVILYEALESISNAAEGEDFVDVSTVAQEALGKVDLGPAESLAKADAEEVAAMASFIVRHKPVGFVDHACSECISLGEMVVKGFKCAYHIALSRRNDLGRGAK